MIRNGKESWSRTDSFDERGLWTVLHAAPLDDCAVTKALLAVNLFLHCAAVIETPVSTGFLV